VIISLGRSEVIDLITEEFQKFSDYDIGSVQYYEGEFQIELTKKQSIKQPPLQPIATAPIEDDLPF
jgi:hypothetical protein